MVISIPNSSVHRLDGLDGPTFTRYCTPLTHVLRPDSSTCSRAHRSTTSICRLQFSVTAPGVFTYTVIPLPIISIRDQAPSLIGLFLLLDSFFSLSHHLAVVPSSTTCCPSFTCVYFFLIPTVRSFVCGVFLH